MLVCWRSVSPPRLTSVSMLDADGPNPPIPPPKVPVYDELLPNEEVGLEPGEFVLVDDVDPGEPLHM